MRENISSLAEVSDPPQEAAKLREEAVRVLQEKNSDTIDTFFKKNKDLCFDPHVHEAAKERTMDYLKRRKIDGAQEILERFNLSPQDPEIREAAKKRVIYFLERGMMDRAGKILTSFRMIQRSVYESVKDNTRLVVLLYPFCSEVISGEEINQAYSEQKEQIGARDLEVKENFETLERILGDARTKRLLLSLSDFWENPHDHLLFMNTFRSRSPQDREYITRLVFEPLLVPGVDLESLNPLLGSFDPTIYVRERSGTPFRTMKELEREANMQKFNIRIPEDASDAFKEAVRQLVLAPGVDVSFLRSMITEYEAIAQGGRIDKTSKAEMHKVNTTQMNRMGMNTMSTTMSMMTITMMNTMKNQINCSPKPSSVLSKGGIPSTSVSSFVPGKRKSHSIPCTKLCSARSRI
ncbi:MAG: hypothetical protein IPL87_04100 [Candidatus Moraniibacteriota bacterium]|nr:MAG: hypothetical protein IPL87_04100 [Candidatus Moranbacteria bacterium]